MPIVHAPRQMNWLFDAPTRLSVTLHTDAAPSAESWRSYVTAIAQLPCVEEYRVFAYSAGGMPSAPQREELARALKGKEARSAFLTASRPVRLMVTAVSWFNPHIKAFADDDIEGAQRHLALSVEHRIALEMFCERLAASLHLDLPWQPRPFSRIGA